MSIDIPSIVTPGLSVHIDIYTILVWIVVGLVAGRPGLPNSPREMFWKGAAAAAILLTVYAWYSALFRTRGML